jgi:hypothetical protein
MSLFQQLNYGKFEEIWGEEGGGYKQSAGNITLYWDRIDHQNHCHLFYDEQERKWCYNIKCYGNSGNSRIKHCIEGHETLEELKEQIIRHWREECPEFIEEFEGGGKHPMARKMKNSKKRKTSKKTTKKTSKKTTKKTRKSATKKKKS